MGKKWIKLSVIKIPVQNCTSMSPEFKNNHVRFYVQSNEQHRFEVTISQSPQCLIEQVRALEQMQVGSPGAVRYVAEYSFPVDTGLKQEQMLEVATKFQQAALAYGITLDQDFDGKPIVNRLNVLQSDEDIFIRLNQNDRWAIGLGRNVYRDPSQNPNRSTIGIYVQEIATKEDIERVRKEVEENVDRFIEKVAEAATENNPYVINLGIPANQPNSNFLLREKSRVICDIFGVTEPVQLNEIFNKTNQVKYPRELVRTDLWKIEVVQGFDKNSNLVYNFAISPGPRTEV